MDTGVYKWGMANQCSEVVVEKHQKGRKNGVVDLEVAYVKRKSSYTYTRGNIKVSIPDDPIRRNSR